MSLRQSEEYLRHLLGLFSDANRFKFVRKLPSNGGCGFCLCFAERGPTGQVRKIVVKCPNDDEQVVIEGLKNEIKWLESLKYAEHIVTILKLTNNPLLPDRNGRGGLSQPSMILEYVENGTVGGLLDRTRRRAVIPNRILWLILLCMARACVAMAYPPGQGQPEEIKPALKPSNLAHWDMHNGNFMFGLLDRTEEHKILPILKLIDFDLAEWKSDDEEEEVSDSELAEYDNELELDRYRNEASPRNPGTDANVFTVGLAMTRIIAHVENMDHEDSRAEIQKDHPNVDEALQLLIVRCLAFDPKNRPRLGDLLTKAYQGVVKGNPKEPDRYIQGFTQQFILNADT